MYFGVLNAIIHQYYRARRNHCRECIKVCVYEVTVTDIAS